MTTLFGGNMKSIYIIISTICIFCSSLSVAYAEEKGYYPYYTEDDYKVPEGAEKSFTIYTGEDGSLPPSRIVTGTFLEKVEAYEYLNEELDDVSMYSFEIDLVGVNCHTEDFYSERTEKASIIYILIEDEYFDANLNFEDKFYIQAVGSGNTISVHDITSEWAWGRPVGVEYTEDGKKVIEILTLYNPVEHKYYISQKYDEIYGPIDDYGLVTTFAGTIYMGDIVVDKFAEAPECYTDAVVCEVHVLESTLQDRPKELHVMCERETYYSLLEENLAYGVIMEQSAATYENEPLFMLNHIYLQNIEPNIYNRLDIEEAKDAYDTSLSKINEALGTDSLTQKTKKEIGEFVSNNKLTLLVLVVLLGIEVCNIIIGRKKKEKKHEGNSESNKA